MKVLFWISFLLISTYSQSQWTIANTSKQAVSVVTPSNITLYNVEFELLDESLLGDSSILATINTKQFNYFREQSIDVQFTEKNSGLTFIVYSFDKIRRIKYPKNDSLNIINEH